MLAICSFFFLSLSQFVGFANFICEPEPWHACSVVSPVLESISTVACIQTCIHNCLLTYLLTCMHACIHRLDGWMDGWVHAWMDGWMDGWMDR